MMDFRRLHPSEAELLVTYYSGKASGARWPRREERYAPAPNRPERRRLHR